MAAKRSTGSTSPSTGKGKSGNWIKNAVDPAERGSLHKALGIPQGQTIPKAREQAAAHSSNPTLRHKAQFALNVRGLGKGKGR